MSFFNMMTKSFQSIKNFSASNYRTMISYICFFVRWFCGKFLFINFSQFFNIFLKHLTPCQIVVKLFFVFHNESYYMSHTVYMTHTVWLIPWENNPCDRYAYQVRSDWWIHARISYIWLANRDLRKFWNEWLHLHHVILWYVSIMLWLLQIIVNNFRPCILLFVFSG